MLIYSSSNERVQAFSSELNDDPSLLTKTGSKSRLLLLDDDDDDEIVEVDEVGR